jgi:hypothetical protein
VKSNRTPRANIVGDDTKDELLDEALQETYSASDPIVHTPMPRAATASRHYQIPPSC